MSLSKIITARIRETGPISFHDFMEMALYYPGLGYYTSQSSTIGRQGDFYTSSNLTSAMGSVIATQLEQVWELLGKRPLTVVEYGAGTGQLCYDVMRSLQYNKPLYNELRYCIIEKSATLRTLQQRLLHDKVSWVNELAEIGEIEGCILSNELVDNFAVHQVVMKNELMEVFVDYEDGFAERLIPASGELKNYLNRMGVRLPFGYRTEISLDGKDWMIEIATHLKKGYVLTIDYGYTATQYYDCKRSQGTLICYHKHQVNDDPYVNIGEQDITCHVNFSALQAWGTQSGLRSCGLIDFPSFLLSLGFRNHLASSLEKEEDMFSAARKLSFLTHTMLVDMGNKFKVLIQEKGMGEQDLLALRLSRSMQQFDPSPTGA
jgi:SAM-dependent MidA family methyltransferase